MFWIFKNTTVDAVIANFNKTIEDLRSIEKAHDEQIAHKQLTISKLSAEIEGHCDEALRAHNIASNISDLITR